MQMMNHWQRIEAALAGAATDTTPIALWRHFPEDDLVPEKLAALTLKWQKKWDFDLVKFMPSGTYGVEDWGAVSAYLGSPNGARDVIKPGIARTGDWSKLEALDVRKGSYGRQLRSLAMVAAELGGSVPILQTIFSPLTTARKLAGERLFTDLRCSPGALEHALRVITDVTIRFALESFAAGAHGTFFATQLTSYRLLSEAEYLRFGKAFDLQVLSALQGKGRLHMLHAHGNDIMFDLLADYPVQMMNWHDRVTEPSLSEAQKRFGGMVVGGLSEKDTLVHGTEADVEAEVRDALAQTGGRRVMIGPGCVMAVTAPDANIEAAVRAARQGI
jgi:uroporphyrinogen decarboxylase